MSYVHDYISGPHDGPRCSCKHDGRKWLSRCVAAAANDHKTDAAWAADHIRLNPNTTFTPEYRALAAGAGPVTPPSDNEDLR